LFNIEEGVFGGLGKGCGLGKSCGQKNRLSNGTTVMTFYL